MLLSKLPFAHHAVFDSVMNKHKPCLKKTQRKHLDKIQEWVEDPSAKLILWLHGMAGTGKSSISQTVATCLDKGLSFATEEKRTNGAYLGASFFLKQDDNTRNGILNLFPTIAHTLVERVPALKQYITDAIRGNEKVGTKKLSEQMNTLIFKPLSEFGKHLALPIRLVIVLDALDECTDHSEAQEMLKLLPNLRDLHHVQIRFLITSRPESHIQGAMLSAMQSDYVNTLVLGKIPQVKLGDPNPDDITLFVTHELDRITTDRGLQEDWISDKISDIIKKADGLFIYAATICRFLDWSMPDSRRNDRVNSILENKGGDNTDSPDNRVAEIYLKVLSFPGITLSPKEKAQMYATVKHILAFVAIVFEPVTVTTLGSLLEMEKRSVLQELEELHSIVNIPKDEASPLGFFHLSFREYLLAKDRSGPDFWVDEGATHHSLFHSCLKIMKGELRQDMCDVQLPGTLVAEIPKSKIKEKVSPHLQYSCLYWVRHLVELNKSQPCWLAEPENRKVIYTFLTESFMYWLEALSLTGKMPASIIMINDLQTLIKVSTPLYLSKCAH